MRIDAHQHFWRYNPVDYAWIDESMAAIQRDFLPADLAPVLQQHGFDGCVVVQTEQTEESNQTLVDWASANPFIKGVVGWTDLTAPNIKDALSAYKKHKTVKGFRHVLQGEKDRAIMLRDDFKRGIAALGDAGFTYDILIYLDQLPFIETFVQEFPEQRFIIDHLAKPYIKRGEVDEWKGHMQKIGTFQNVYCKVSGMVTEASWQAWKKEDFWPYLDAVVAAFGTERLVYGSDWPVCLVAASYGAMLGIVEDYFSSFSADEKEAIFGGNAVRFYQLS
jgi:L-fuconolactonase